MENLKTLLYPLTSKTEAMEVHEQIDTFFSFFEALQVVDQMLIS